MQVKKNQNEGYTKFSIIGELDASSSIQMDDALKQALEDGDVQMLIDCSGLEYISSAGLGVFVSNIEDIKSKNGSLVFCDVNEEILSVFQVLGLDKIVTIVKEENDAKALFV